MSKLSKLIALSVSSTFVLLSTAPASFAGTARDSAISLSAPSTFKMKKSGCSTLRFTYKIQPEYRDYGALIRFSLASSANQENPEKEFDVVMWKYNWVNGQIESNNVDFTEEIPLKICKTVRTETSNVSGLNRSGTYFITADSQFETDGNPGTAPKLSWVTLKVKVNVA
jgi:hypothetical protein